jgi:flagellar basal-body rod modification protein FlgD
MSTSNAATMLPSLINNTSTSTSTASAATSSASQQIAGNFDTFLQLLTTQLQNQNPLDPLDTNQFTEQLVEFASFEQQINENTNLQTLISMQQTSEATSALQLVGSTGDGRRQFGCAIQRHQQLRDLESHLNDAGHRDGHRDQCGRHNGV